MGRPDRREVGRDVGAVALLLLVVGALFAVLEAREPHYFLWDDNASFYLPSYTYAGESLLDRGELAHLNPHQYLDQTFLASGQTGVLYPPVYLAVAATRLVAGDPRAVVDVLAIFHFLAATLGMYLLLRHFALGRAAAVGAGLLWVSFPFLVVVSRSWVFVSYAAAFLPFSLLALERLLERPTRGRIVVLAAVKALFFNQGYVQYFVLATLFEGVYVLLRWLARRPDRKRLWREAGAFVLALAATTALAAPLLLPMLYAKEVSAYRTGSLAFEEFISNALDVGVFLRAQIFDMAPRAVHLSSGAIFYLGLPNLLVLGVLLRRRDRRTFFAALGVAVLALVLSTEAFGLAYRLPILSSFRWPFKSFLIALFYATLGLAAAYDHLLASRRTALRGLGAAVLLLGLGTNVALLSLDRFNAPFGPNRIDTDVATFRAATTERFDVESGRVVSLWLQPAHPRIERFLIFNYATLAGAYHLGGYDPLVARENLELALKLDYSNIFRYEMSEPMLDYLGAWSVRHLLVPARPELRQVLERFARLEPRRRDGDLEVWELTTALPFAAFPGPAGPLPVEVDWGGRGMRLETAGRGGILRLAIAPLPWLEATADGTEIAFEVAEEGWLLLDVPDGTREVTVRYVDVPFRIGAGIFVAFLLSVGAMMFLRRQRSTEAARFTATRAPSAPRRKG